MTKFLQEVRTTNEASRVVPWLTQTNSRRWRPAAIFNFGKKYQLRIGQRYLHQISWEDAPRPCGDDHVTKSRNRKLICVTSSNEGLKHMCIDLSDCNRYLNQIWYRTQIPHYINTPEWPNSHNLKIQDGGGRHLEFWKMSNCGLDKDISFFGTQCRW